MKHTPAPWVMHAKSISGAYQITGATDGSLRIATVTNAPNDEANARLIAAAPELLEALKAMTERAESMASMLNSMGLPAYYLEAAPKIEAARATIQKAER